MKRSGLGELCSRPFDLLVAGGGIYGLMAAWDASLRGLRVALVERSDFGGGSSHNSLKIMHGGIRYVQHLDFRRLRSSARERAFWQRAAPGLVRPLEFTIPLYGHGSRGPEAFRAATALYNLASAGLRGPGYPGARTVGAAEARARLGRLAGADLTGGGVWRDGQITDVNQLHMALLRAALSQGACAANYMEVTGFAAEGARIAGAFLRDRLTGETGRLSATVTLSCTGGRAPALAAPHLPAGSGFPGFARATNLVLDLPAATMARAVVGRAESDAVVSRGGRMYFLTPWKHLTIAGTHEAPARGAAKSDADVDDFLAELNLAAPELRLSRGNVLWVQQGLIPADVDDARGVRRKTRGALIDHSQAGLPGLVSAIGVKYTTARLIAERAVDLAASQLPVSGGASRSSGETLAVDLRDDPDPLDGAAASERIRHAVGAEMAVTLEDVMIRRTGWAETGAIRRPGAMESLRRAATGLCLDGPLDQLPPVRKEA
ncbi:FAD-dependent oxidoreductase [Poseidonocella sp. HB161398]|uniref:FAD-dependent oxidoreductase n=1 Tax=Poseidonocella sp. HB161398 TaxID=2320855 RepID=UPI0014864261|nr:FAD-dependent oxidoreductase [Poseidonocella sp. HB161398]